MLWLKRQLNRIRNKPSRRLNVAMFHSGRCGSTVLGNVLNQHSQIRWADEVFEVPHYKKLIAEGLSPLDAIDCSMYSSATPIYGFETKALRQLHLRPEFLDMTLAEYVAWLERRGFSKFITLNRKNYLRRVVSAIGLREKGVTHVRQHRTDVTAAPLDVNNVPIGIANLTLLGYFEVLDAHYVELAQVLTGRDVLDLTYEDDILNDPRAGYERVCEFLGVNIEPVEVKLGRTNPGTLRELIANLEEVTATLRGTKYAWMLED